MAGTLKSLKAFDLISLARSTPSGDHYNPDHVEQVADFINSVDLCDDQVADVGALLDGEIAEIDGWDVKFCGYADLDLPDHDEPVRYVLGNVL